MTARPRRWLGLAAAVLALGACGGAPAAPDAARPQSSSPPRLTWRAGDSFRASMDQQVHAATGPAAVDLAMTSVQDLGVESVRGGVADLLVTVTARGWRNTGTYQGIDELPPPWHLQVGPDGAIRSGRYWGLPQDPPLQGVDFFSAGLPPTGWSRHGPWSGSWPRTLEDGSPLVYQVRQAGPTHPAAGQTAVETTASCQLTHQAFTPDAQPDLVRGSVQAVIRSVFDNGSGRLLSTVYTSSFTLQETEPRGGTTTQGSVVTTIRFSY